MKTLVLVIPAAIAILLTICGFKFSALFFYNTLNIYINLAILVAGTLLLHYLPRVKGSRFLLPYILLTTVGINSFTSLLAGIVKKSMEASDETNDMSGMIIYFILYVFCVCWGLYWKRKFGTAQ